MELRYRDRSIVVCIKPPKLLSTDEPGGLPEQIRAALGDPGADIRTVHRLDRAASGLMVLARSGSAASELSRQIREGRFGKEYLAVVLGQTEDRGELRDLLVRDKARKMTFVAEGPGKGVQEARLAYETLERTKEMSLVRIRLYTGRTHQIRCQFAAHGFPLAGDRKYGGGAVDCPLALWSFRLEFDHPETGERLSFSAPMPQREPWDRFNAPGRRL